METPNLTAARLGEMHAQLAKLTSSPAAHDLLELVIATVISARGSIQEAAPLVWLWIIGPPSSGKTLIVLLVRGVGEAVVFLDKLTPASFASGAYDPKSGKKAKPLLPKLHGRCLIVKDLTTLFSMREDKVKGLLGDMQSIFDGEFAVATGMAFDEEDLAPTYQGQFTFLACVTPDAVARHQRYMAQIGSRVLHYRVPPLTAAETSKGFDLASASAQKAGREVLRQLVHKHVEALLVDPVQTHIPEWSEVRLRLLSLLVAQGRTPMRWERGADGRYVSMLGSQEAPFRVYHQLSALLRALVQVNGRFEPTAHELELVQRVALSSLPENRWQVVEAFRRSPVVVHELNGQAGPWLGLTARSCAISLSLGTDQAANRLEEVAKVGLFVEHSGVLKNGPGRPADFYRPCPEYAGLMIGGVLGFPEETSHHLTPSPDVISV